MLCGRFLFQHGGARAPLRISEAIGIKPVLHAYSTREEKYERRGTYARCYNYVSAAAPMTAAMQGEDHVTLQVRCHRSHIRRRLD